MLLNGLAQPQFRRLPAHGFNGQCKEVFERHAHIRTLTDDIPIHGSGERLVLHFLFQAGDLHAVNARGAYQRGGADQAGYGFAAAQRHIKTPVHRAAIAFRVMGANGLQCFLRQRVFQLFRAFQAVPRRFVCGKRVIPVVQQTGHTPQFLILAKMTGQSPHHGLTGQRMLNKVRLRAGFAQKIQCSFTINHGALP